jgi:hypothetical protein
MAADAAATRPTELDATTGGPSPDIHLTVTVQMFDALDELARRRRESVQQVIRAELQRVLVKERRHDPPR